MRFRISQTFRGSVEEVEGAFIDPAYLAQLTELPKLGRPALVHQVVAGDLVHQWVAYRFVGELNAAVRRVIDPARLTWTEESTLDRATHCTTWRIVPDHYKSMLRSAGTFQLTPGKEAGTTQRVADGEVKVTVPLVGGKVEAAIVSGLREHARLEEEVMARWLERRGTGS